MNSSEDKVLSILAIVAVVLLSCIFMTGPRKHERRISQPAQVDEGTILEARVTAIAQSIATAEGYYAAGDYDGHALPYKLHNPGSLKKPAFGADDLPTWKDTGLVVFPTEELGWAALRHQVNLMLNGDSDVYSPSDTLRSVAVKYAGGDVNWALQVANNLGVSPESTLSEVSAALPASSGGVPVPEVQPALPSRPASGK